MIEKRQRVRWQINIKAKVRLEGAVADMPCIINDLNFNGARITLAPRLPQGRLIKMRVTLVPGFVFEAEAWPVWHRRIMDKNAYGLYFNKMTQADNSVIFKFMQRDFSKVLGNLKEPVVSGISEKKGGEEKMADRRVFERLSTNLSVTFKGLNNEKSEAITCDVSAQGLGIVCRKPMETGDVLELWLDMPDKKAPLYTRGRVAWAREENAGRQRAGIALERPEFMGLSRLFWI